MLNLSQLGNVVSVAPAVVLDRRNTTKCAGIAICGLSTTFRKERNELV